MKWPWSLLRKRNTESEADGAVLLWPSAMCEWVCVLFFFVPEHICYSLQWVFGNLNLQWCIHQALRVTILYIQSSNESKWLKWMKHSVWGASLIYCIFSHFLPCYWNMLRKHSVTPDCKCWEAMLLCCCSVWLSTFCHVTTMVWTQNA